MSTKIIILDFDGTLGDTTDVIIRTTQTAIKELGLPSRTDAECAAMIGLRLVEIPPVLFPGLEVDCDLYAQTYRRIFNILNTPDAVTLYPHVLETLKELKSRGLTLTIASSRSNNSLKEYIDNLDLASTITYILGGNDVSNGKPHPEAVNMTLERFGYKPEEAIVVGDTVFDIHMGRNAGTRTCGVSYGNGTRETFSDATWIIDDFSDLLKLI